MWQLLTPLNEKEVQGEWPQVFHWESLYFLFFQLVSWHCVPSRNIKNRTKIIYRLPEIWTISLTYYGRWEYIPIHIVRKPWTEVYIPLEYSDGLLLNANCITVNTYTICMPYPWRVMTSRLSQCSIISHTYTCQVHNNTIRLSNNFLLKF